MADKQESKKLLLQDVEVLAGKRHEHRGRVFTAGDVIKGMHQDSADWLIGKKIVKAVGTPYVPTA